MKKVFKLLAIALFGLNTMVATAQTVQASKKELATQVVHKKADGTPDKRFKENKTTESVHLKKDGIPDKRFKENKTTTVVKKKP